MRPTDAVRRRAVLAGGTALAAGGLAGCLGGSDDSDDAGDDGTSEGLPTPVAGDPEAPVTVAGYEDYACPHCARYSVEVLPRLFEEYADPGRIRYEFHDFPIPVDRTWSWAAASGARSVQDNEGVGTFWPFTEALFERQSDLGDGALRGAARAVGVDADRVRRDAREGAYRETVLADRRAAVDRGVEATPTVLVDGDRVEPTYDAISSAVDAALG